ncbi:putative dehydrogenase [Algoriphagus boseongensis]|uniref:Putative dehydrogenase n=1 Tax=Algoriphagus boseongensis TaxID=1442587 RepID=A0A4R6T6P2_9BACT|nr:Gfo/Idh/MocA family oxidoreductase [Algoriphagus boseongensis]TDQ16330.1 putative dehydrogenase [Algoriphagus boseongensis]
MKFGIGIIGTGAIAIKHAQAIESLDNARLLGLFNPNPSSAEKAKEKFSAPVFQDLKEFLAISGLDVVCICTPSGLHLEPALAALEAKKHVFIEKPIEVTLDRADRLIASADKNGVTLGVVFQNRFSSDFQKLRKAVQAGEFGRLLMGNAYVNWFRTAEYYSSSQWKGTLKCDGGGALINQAIHTLDLLLDVMGEVDSVFGKVKTSLYPIEGEDLGAALVNFRSGASGTITAGTSLYPGYPERLEIYGTEGSAILEAGKLIAWTIKGKDSPLEKSEKISTSGSSDPNAIGFELHAAQWKDFLKSIANGTSPEVDGPEAKKSLELIRGIYKSSKEEKLVKFPFEE